MHERTQRRVCRIIYVLVCVVPTILILAGVLYCHRPWRERDWQQFLEGSLHVRTTLSQVTTPRPGVWQFDKIRLADLHSETPLATIDNLRVVSGNALFAERFELESLTAKTLRTLQGWLSTSTSAACEVRVNRLVLSKSEDQLCELSDVVLLVQKPSSQLVKLSLRGDFMDGKTVRLEMEQTPEKIWLCSLDCREGQLPAWLFTDFLPGAARWTSAQFAGSVKLRSDAMNSWKGYLEGAFAPIDLQTWLGTDSPHKFPATAQLRLDSLEWQHQRITEAQGTLQAERGEISQSLLTALTKSLYCVVGKQLPEGADLETVSFENLSCRFKLSSVGLTILGKPSPSAGESPGCLMLHKGTPLLLQPTYSNLPLAYFVQVFCPLDKYWLPGMRKAADLAETLPMPENGPVRK